MRDVRSRLQHHLEVLYPEHDPESLCTELLGIMRLRQVEDAPVPPPASTWDASNIFIITYANSFLADSDTPPLATLHDFLHRFLHPCISGVHILPFFPWSSDDGFAVMDYDQVNPELGDWSHIEAIAADFDLMADLVINHCSSQHPWFQNFQQGEKRGQNYFFTASPEDDLSAVIRPRTSELLKTVETPDGTRHVWCTFGPDQVDLDFRNPEVLLEFIHIIRHYLDRGIRVFRLDAVAFIWKEVGSNCLNLPQAHEIVRLLRALIEQADPQAIIITETNIPKRENLSYFGNSNEAHSIYNFSLPPLLLHTLLSANCHHLKNWLMSMPPAQTGTFYFNFIASHDGIGLRPAEGLLDDGEIETLIRTTEQFGGRISWRASSGLERRPYEINISLWDALQGTSAGKDEWQLERFLCAHTILLALEGIPAFYIHSLLATGNDHQRVLASGHNRHINRHHWSYNELLGELDDSRSHHHQAFNHLLDRIAIRKRQAAFHPNATQFTLHLGDQVFAFWRQSLHREQSIFALHNISSQPQNIFLSDINLVDTDEWFELLSGQTLDITQDSLTLEPYQCAWISNQGP